MTLEQFEEVTKRSIDQLNSLLSIAHDEEKEEGQPRENTIHYFNALYYAMEEARQSLLRGLEGNFPWEKEEQNE